MVVYYTEYIAYQIYSNITMNEKMNKYYLRSFSLVTD
jgi:hypothetical protein